MYQKTVDAMAAEGRPFKGIIFFGLMLTQDGPKVLEYNARFGDPEAQVVLPRMKNDIIEVISRYMDIDAEALDVKITETESDSNNGTVPALVANIPIRDMKHRPDPR